MINNVSVFFSYLEIKQLHYILMLDFLKKNINYLDSRKFRFKEQTLLISLVC